MKKLFALLLAMMLVFSLAACGDNNATDPDKDNPGISQSGDQGGENSTGNESNDDNSNQGGIAGTNNGEWPKNEWTSHVPEADGTVLKIDENMDTGMGKAYVLYMDWTDEDAVAYGKKLVEAGKVEAINEDISDGVFYLLYTDVEIGRMVMINELGETENDYVIVLYK